MTTPVGKEPIRYARTITAAKVGIIFMPLLSGRLGDLIKRATA
jgi:hypothetical protein